MDDLNISNICLDDRDTHNDSCEIDAKIERVRSMMEAKLKPLDDDLAKVAYSTFSSHTKLRRIEHELKKQQEINSDMKYYLRAIEIVYEENKRKSDVEKEKIVKELETCKSEVECWKKKYFKMKGLLENAQAENKSLTQIIQRK